VKVDEDDGVVGAVLRKVQQDNNYVWSGKCPMRYTWVDGCKTVEFDDVRD